MVFEADYQQTGREYGHRDMVFGSGYQDPAHFYSTHIATAGTVRVFFDDLKKPIMSAEEKTFGPGAIGSRSFDDTGKIANIKGWGTAVGSTPTKPFPTKP